MPVKDQIKPISHDHSIKEAVISIFLSSPIIKPSRFKALIDTEFKELYQEFEILKQFKLKFSVNTIKNPETHFQDEAGFSFSQFENGIKKTVVQGINEENRQYISFHSLKYKRWEDFLQQFNLIISAISKFQSDLFVIAISLHYIDEFNWVDETNAMDLKVIFNQDSNILPLKFFNSLNAQFSLITENEEIGKRYLNNIQITTESIINHNIQLSHNISRSLEDNIDLKELIQSDLIYEILNTAHIKNKELLRELLTTEVQNLIKLNP